MICPFCATVLTDEQSVCPRCGADLDPYISLYYQPDLLFNRALTDLERKNVSGAMEKLSAARYLRPDDRDIRALYLKACYHGNNYASALDILLDMADEDPENAELQEEIEKLTKRLDQEGVPARQKNYPPKKKKNQKKKHRG